MMFALPDFMASSNVRTSDSPHPLQSSQSFSKLEPRSHDCSPRTQRANTIQNGVTPEPAAPYQANSRNRMAGTPEDQVDRGPDIQVQVGDKLPADFDELPIELVSLADSFIDSLSAKVHPTPPTADKLSSLFQDFYVVATTHINTHISALSSRQQRGKSPVPSVSSLSSTASKIRATAVSIGNKDRPKALPERRDSEQQMLTAEEIADRKRSRRVLELKRVALEEAVERRLCERIYDRIFRHRSTQDEAQDEKLRSKTAALSVVGIGLGDLGIDLGHTNDPDSSEDKETEVREWLEGARNELVAMNDQKYPLGKLHHLKAAHKSIVDTLSHFHPSSSADEIMPMLIYTLITSRPEGIDVISNLYFIQRFRNESKIDGEAAYCLTNLEAAITFLETVDLASLRADEAPSGPPKSNSRPTTPKLEKPGSTTLGLTPPSLISTPEVSAPATNVTDTQGIASPAGLRPSIQVHNRRISEMFQPPAQVFGAAGDAVLNTADQGFKTIGNSLGESYKFLVGKLKERQNETIGFSSDIIVPKTLDDARKLVSTPPLEAELSTSGARSLHVPEKIGQMRNSSGPNQGERMLGLIGGRKTARDRSADSNQSSGSNQKLALTEQTGEKGTTPSPPAPLTSTNPAIVESMRNLGNTLNPMNRIAGMSMMRGFGRPPVASSPTPPASKSIPDGRVADLVTTFPDLAPALPPKESDITKVAPPIKKFMELENPGDLKLNEVLELLRDYRRLAGALEDMGAV
ncbi:VPS9 protein [Venustampulla echinocandica]|uniref:VPS9 protein n=1 Tax=Venustampulla echinocandica TaxID=2656787 RepID=A0A370TCY8_9HELO|nr:VPS9 protein [Venustampulla echinocandica]RDL32123.1 VPS9 protein [Venustampulla echinocandica]